MSFFVFEVMMKSLRKRDMRTIAAIVVRVMADLVRIFFFMVVHW